MFNNRTRNQHFIAQVEQKLNAIDPTVDKDKRRIYEFEISDREKLNYAITNSAGVKIENNLSFYDLYTFDVFSDETRNNFEKFFQKYESKIEVYTNRFLEKMQKKEKISKEELFDLIFCKIMNLIRNPFSVIKVLNTLGSLAEVKPTDPNLLREFDKIEKSNLKVDDETLKLLNISDDQFVKWLKVIFNFFAVEIDGKSLGELTVQNFSNNSKVYINVFSYKKEVCLLSDRGYVDYSPGFENSAFSMSFNLNKNNFLNFSFFEISWDNFKKITPHVLPMIETLQKSGVDIKTLFKPEIEVATTKFECLEALENYNSNALVQCHNNVYCAEEKFKVWRQD
ncbi:MULTISPECIES: hypothetical protein [Acinetobacter calcoaceticus/baumannii complex]|uniref:hypothetical protein n=1 Tax=Acinetobacter calcoaceticus/baumannii complex TaxID=909768 RepID=UPI00396CE41F